MTLVMLYGLTVHALWHAPLYAWLLLVSGWARRTPFLWAVLPPLALGVLERIAFQTLAFRLPAEVPPRWAPCRRRSPSRPGTRTSSG